MRRQLLAFVAATLLTITAGVVAQTSGFPSRPRFLTASAVGGGAAFVARGLTTGAASNVWLEFQDSAGIATGYVGDGSSGNANLNLTAYTAGANIILTPGSGGAVQIGASTVQTGALTVVAYASILGSGAGCPLSGAFSSRGISGCARAGVGVYNLTFNAGFSTIPVCTASANSSNNAAQFDGSSSTAGTITVRALTTGTVADGGAFVTCMGS